MESRAALCGDCKVPCNDFKKIVDLKSSGLAIYVIQNDPTSTIKKKSNDCRKSDSFILHNTSKKDIKRKDFVIELNEYNTKCSNCKTLVHKVKSLLVDLCEMKQDEVRGVCIHCYRRNLAGKCKRCEQIVHKYVTSKVQQYEESQTKVTDWINRIRNILKTLLERDTVCRHNVHHESSGAQIQKLLQELKSLEAPYKQRQPKIYDFSGLRMPCSNGMVSKDKEPRSSNHMATSCVCKYFMDKNIEGRGSIEVLFKENKREPGISFRDTENKKDYRFDSDERDFSYSDRHERDFRYPGRDDINYRYTRRDDRDYSYESHGKVYRFPGERESDFLSLGRDNRDYRSPVRDDREYHSSERGNRDYRSPGRDDRDYRTPDRDERDYQSPGRGYRDYRSIDRGDRDGLHDNRNYKNTHGISRYDSDSYYAGKERERRDMGRDNKDYSPGRDDKEGRYGKRDCRETRTSGKEHREARGPGNEYRKYSSPDRDHINSRQEGRDDKRSRRTERDDRETRQSANNDNAHSFALGVGRANRYGRQERDVKDNEFYFPKKDDKDFRHPDKGSRDQGSPDNEKNKRKPTLDDKGKDIEGDQKPKKEDKEHDGERKIRAKEKEEEGRERESDREKEREKGGTVERETAEDKVKSAKDTKNKHEKNEKGEIKRGKNIKVEEKYSNIEKKALSKGWIRQKSKELSVVLGSKSGERAQSKDADAKTKGIKVGVGTSKEKIIGESSKDDTMYKENKKPGKKKGKSEEGTDLDKRKEMTDKKVKITSEEKLLLKMMKERKEKRERNQARKNQKDIQMPVFEDLPEIKIPEPVIEVELSESVIICGDQKPYHPTEMVKGSDISPYDKNYKDEKAVDMSHKPMLFETNPKCPPAVIDVLQPAEPLASSIIEKKVKGDKGDAKVEVAPSGIVKYQLSNREFIDKGWTVLPATKVMRRMTIYKMLPVNPNCNWFARHISDKRVFYDTGERLAEINADGTGQWYYKTGVVALDYYNSEDPCTNQRYVIYSHANDTEARETKPVTVLASFDYLGNGVVYDSCGNIRLKYNQSEGMVVDEMIGPPGVWKWHTLNDPPVLEPMFLDTRSKHPDPRIEAIVEVSDKDKSSAKSVKFIKSMLDKSTNMMQDEAEEIIAIELENFAKSQALKLSQKFKPFQITRKIFKINNYFSLKILDQTNIYLMFRDGQVSLKLNLGMQLVSTEIVDTDASETVHVPTPYDVLPPKTASLAHIQSYLKKAKQAK